MTNAAARKQAERVCEDAAVVDAVTAYVLAVAHRDTVAAKVQPIQRDILQRFGLVHSVTGEVITDIEKLYMCDDDEGCARLYEALTAAYRTVPEWSDLPMHHCPKLIADQGVLKAQRALVEAAGPHIGITWEAATRKLGDLERLVELVVGLVKNYGQRRKAG